MSAMKETILPSRKKSKHKKRKHGKVTGSDSDDMFEGIEKVHQDDDYSMIFYSFYLSFITFINYITNN